MKLTKSKQFLADAIHASGKGWPDGANWAAQDKTDGQRKDNTICFFSGKSKPVCIGAPKMWRCGSPHSTFIGYQYIVKCTKLSPNWHQTILSREEYFSAYPVPADDTDGWIEWGGGDCPVGDECLVDVKTRDGEVDRGDKAYYWNWSHREMDCKMSRQVIAYRLHNPDSNVVDAKPTPEPEAKPTIEQLAADYRNKLDYANRKQQEADDAKAAADASLGELERAGETLGLVISIATPEPELVITDWRDLQPMDEVRCTQVNTWGGDYADHIIGTIGVVLETNEPAKSGQAVKALFGHDEVWISGWEFIRRP